MGIKISGLGAAVPANKVTNGDLSLKLNIDDAWVTSRTGIKSRYHSNRTEKTSKLAYEAAKAAMMRMLTQHSHLIH